MKRTPYIAIVMACLSCLTVSVQANDTVDRIRETANIVADKTREVAERTGEVAEDAVARSKEIGKDVGEQGSKAWKNAKGYIESHACGSQDALNCIEE